MPCVLSDQVPHEADVSGQSAFISIQEPDSWASEILRIQGADKREQINSNKKLDFYDIEEQSKKICAQYEYLSREKVK